MLCEIFKFNKIFQFSYQINDVTPNYVSTVKDFKALETLGFVLRKCADFSLKSVKLEGTSLIMTKNEAYRKTQRLAFKIYIEVQYKGIYRWWIWLLGSRENNSHHKSANAKKRATVRINVK